MRKPGYANNNGTDQDVHPHCIISISPFLFTAIQTFDMFLAYIDIIEVL